MRELILDTETTGFNIEDGDEVIELAMVEIINNQITGKNYHYFFKPIKNSEISAENVHGLSFFDLEHMESFNYETSKKFLSEINGANLVIHNAAFDIKFLNNHLKKFNLNIFDYCNEVIDSLDIARYKYPNLRNSLDALCERFKINKDSRLYHGALIDCYLLAEVYIQLKKEQQNLFLNNMILIF